MNKKITRRKSIPSLRVDLSCFFIELDFFPVTGVLQHYYNGFEMFQMQQNIQLLLS